VLSVLGSWSFIFSFLCNVVSPSVLFLFVIVLYVLLRFTTDEYPFSILKEEFEDTKGAIRIRISKKN
jgi:uncharacterized membrane protein